MSLLSAWPPGRVIPHTHPNKGSGNPSAKFWGGPVTDREPVPSQRRLREGGGLIHPVGFAGVGGEGVAPGGSWDPSPPWEKGIKEQIPPPQGASLRSAFPSAWEACALGELWAQGLARSPGFPGVRTGRSEAEGNGAGVLRGWGVIQYFLRSSLLSQIPGR